MMFIVRVAGAGPDDAGVRLLLSRETPVLVRERGAERDHFCVAEREAIERLRAGGWNVVAVRDGWYEDGRGGGMAVWGQGEFWEVRDTPFTVRESCQGVGSPGDGRGTGAVVDVRRGIFGV
ncbi:MAG: hypothetical protein U0821_15695 [Chloroflexota bacterium]